MSDVYFKIDTKKRLGEISNAVQVLKARQCEIQKRLKNEQLSANEYLDLITEMLEGMNQAQLYKEEIDELVKIELLKIKRELEGL